MLNKYANLFPQYPMSMHPELVHFCIVKYLKDFSFLLIAVYVRGLTSAQLPKFLLYIFKSKHLIKNKLLYGFIYHLFQKCLLLLEEFSSYIYISLVFNVVVEFFFNIYKESVLHCV